MKIKKHLFKYMRKDNVPYYVITYKRINVANRKNLEDILEIYEECVACKWDICCLEEIKDKYRIGGHRNKMRYIYQNQVGQYFIQKNGKHWASSWDKDEILKFRDMLLESDWDAMVLEDEGYHKRRNHNLPKYIWITPSNRYCISYKGISYGVFSSLEVAVEERDLLIKHDWDYNFVDMY